MEKGDAMRARGAFRDEGKVINMFDAIIRAGIRLTAKAVTLLVLGFGALAILSLEGCGTPSQDATPADATDTVTAEETVETLTMDDGSEIVVDSEGNVVSTSGGAAAEYVASHGSSGVSATKVQADTGKQVSTSTATRPVTRPSTGGAPVTSGGQQSTPQAPTQTQPSQPQAPVQAACAHDWQPVYESREVTVVEAYDYQEKVHVADKYKCIPCGTTFDTMDSLYDHQFSTNHGNSSLVPVYEMKTVHVPAVTEMQSVCTGYKCSKCGVTK